MIRFAAAIVLTFAFLSVTLAGEPATTLAAARAAIDAREYDRAISLLRAAIPDTDAIADPKQHGDALAAIHFYSALAMSGRGSVAEAREELLQFAHYRPGLHKLDAGKYPPEFMKLFTEVVAAPAANAPQAFDRYYPGFEGMRSATPKAVPLALWGASPEVQLLASSEERKTWERLAGDDARREFVANFWVSRDPDASTPLNEWREVFNRRVVFADEAFAGSALRGSTTDRGRVFVLLGPPARVYVRNIGRRQGGFLQVNGTEERWVYFKPQLPSTVRQNEIDFRFIDQPAYGDHVMERDFLPLHALGEARKSLSGTR